MALDESIEKVQSSQGVVEGNSSFLNVTCSEDFVKMVRFAEEVKIISYEFDGRMRKYIWFRKTDYKRFQAEKKETLRHFRHAQSRFERIQEEIFCLRGFEACLSARAVQQRLLRKVAAFQSVLEAQAMQRQLGLEDPGRLQADYHRVTTPARKQALQRAALDAAEVQEYQKDDSRGESDSDEVVSLKSQINRLLHIKAGAAPQTSLRSAASGPLRLRKTVPNTA